MTEYKKADCKWYGYIGPTLCSLNRQPCDERCKMFETKDEKEVPTTYGECPFCGKGFVALVNGVYGTTVGWFYVQCNTCGAKGPMARSIAEAVQNWNARIVSIQMVELSLENEQLRSVEDVHVSARDCWRGIAKNYEQTIATLQAELNCQKDIGPLGVKESTIANLRTKVSELTSDVAALRNRNDELRGAIPDPDLLESAANGHFTSLWAIQQSLHEAAAKIKKVMDMMSVI